MVRFNRLTEGRCAMVQIKDTFNFFIFQTYGHQYKQHTVKYDIIIYDLSRIYIYTLTSISKRVGAQAFPGPTNRTRDAFLIHTFTASPTHIVQHAHTRTFILPETL